MRHCPRCNVTVRGDTPRCPLCQTSLPGEREPAHYPKIQTLYRQYETLFRILILSIVSGGVISTAVDMLIPGPVQWSVFVWLGLLSFGIGVFTVMKRFHNIPRAISNQTFLIAAACVLWDFGTGWRGWSIDYVAPILFIVAMATMAVAARVRKIPAADYIFSFAVGAVYGVAPLIFLLTGVLGVILPSVLCISFSIISLTGILLFQGRDIWQEIVKRFHV